MIVVMSADENPGCESCIGRRALLRGAAGVAGAAVVGAAAPEAGAAGRPWQTLGPLSEVPVGSGKYYPNDGARVVVTRPRRGQLRAFTGYCTHQAGELEQFPARFIQCSSHGSRFRIGNGTVARGPATQRLDQYQVRVRNGMVQYR